MNNKSSRQTSEHVEECVDLRSCAASDDSRLVWEAVSCLPHQSSLPIAAPTMADNKSHMPLNPRNRMPHNLPPALSSLGHGVTLHQLRCRESPRHNHFLPQQNLYSTLTKQDRQILRSHPKPHLCNIGQVLQATVPPVVQLRNAGPRTALRIQLHIRRPQPHKARKQRLIQVTVLLEGHVLHDWRQLVVISDEYNALEPAEAVLLPLQDHWDEGLNLKHLYTGIHVQDSTGQHSTGGQQTPAQMVQKQSAVPIRPTEQVGPAQMQRCTRHSKRETLSPISTPTPAAGSSIDKHSSA